MVNPLWLASPSFWNSHMRKALQKRINAPMSQGGLFLALGTFVDGGGAFSNPSLRDSDTQLGERELKWKARLCVLATHG